MKSNPKRLCACGGPHEAKGLCHRCYQRARNQNQVVREANNARRRESYKLMMQDTEKRRKWKAAVSASYQRRWSDPEKKKAMLDSNRRHSATARAKELRRASARRSSRAKQLKLYGMTLEAYDDLLDSQGGVCKICGDHPRNKSLCVDHNHQTGQIRGLLCGRCNKGLGLFGDDISRVAAAKAYLEAAELTAPRDTLPRKNPNWKTRAKRHRVA